MSTNDWVRGHLCRQRQNTEGIMAFVRWLDGDLTPLEEPLVSRVEALYLRLQSNVSAASG